MLTLYNSMGRQKQSFRPRKKGQVRIFTCGPSIYRRPHIGNYRSFLYEDILVRHLEFLGNRVDRVINFTDVEDKSILEAENKGRNVLELTREVSRHFFDECKLLSIRLPAEVPRSSTTIQESVVITQRLLEKGIAYRHNGSVYFDPLKIDDFGKLFGLDMKRWPQKTVRFSRDTYNGKRWNLGDFILWHGNNHGEEPYWDTAIGRGRPSWNIQDSAIIIKHLGDWVDINCGGIDNIYRHHDYNIAVMEAYTGKEFARYYLHGEHLIVDGRPMSKSKGNILYPQDVLARGHRAHHLRFYLTHTHYRKKLNFTWEHMGQAAGRLDRFRTMVRGLTASRKQEGPADAEALRLAKRIPQDVGSAVNDDLSLGAAFDGLERSLRALDGQALGRGAASGLKDALQKVDALFGFLL